MNMTPRGSIVIQIPLRPRGAVHHQLIQLGEGEVGEGEVGEGGGGEEEVGEGEVGDLEEEDGKVQKTISQASPGSFDQNEG